MSDKSGQTPKGERTWTEEVEIAGSEVIEFVKNLVQEGNVRRLIIRKPTGEIMLEIPLTAGVIVGGAMTLIAPVLAALGAMAALLVHVKIEIVRSESEGDDSSDSE